MDAGGLGAICVSGTLDVRVRVAGCGAASVATFGLPKKDIMLADP